MKLVETLAAGVQGAANGHVELYQRGTSTRANWYGSFEAGSSSTGNVALDQYGGATVYVDGVTDVQVFDSDGVLVRAFTAAGNAGSLETIGPSFTGVDYVSAQSGANKPVTNQAVLDRWLVSGGAVDWKVLVGGVAKTLQNAIGAVSGIVFNVKSMEYGALGDGATDDSTAIQAAIDAANTAGGGVVFFPPGNYVVLTPPTLYNTVSVVGAGPEAVSIRNGHATNATLNISFFGGSMTSVISGISFGATVPNTGEAIALGNTSLDPGKLVIERCWFGRAYDGGDDQTGDFIFNGGDTIQVTMKGCLFVMSGASQRAIRCINADVWWEVHDCVFKSNITGYTSVLVQVNWLFMTGCRFDTSNVTSVHSGVLLERGVIAGTRWEDPATGPITCISPAGGAAATGDVIREFGNVFGTDYAKTLPYGTGNSSRDDTFLTDSRSINWLEITDNTVGTITLPARQFEKISLLRTAAGAQTLQTETPAQPALGSLLCLMLFNDNTSGTITFTWGSEFLTAASTEVLADNAKVVCLFMWDGAVWVQANTFVQV